MTTISYALNERRFSECMDRIKKIPYPGNRISSRLLDVDDSTLEDLREVCEQELERRKGE